MKGSTESTITVSVNGRVWRRVSRFDNAAPNDTVYVVNGKDGSIRFGDGTHGHKPGAGSTISVSYRDGAGSAGNISKRIAGEKQAGKFWVITNRGCQSVGWGKRPC